tara:strand:+ start:540 stop:1922 length:1383 start_codon:yes stop_codon:yes gene_type:complete
MSLNLRNEVAQYSVTDFGIGPPHEAQRRFLRSNAPNVYYLGGRGAGKTTVLVLKSLLYCLKPQNAGLDFGFFAPTYRQMVRSSEPALINMLEDFAGVSGFSLLKKHHRSDHCFELINGSKIFFTSFDRVDRVRSMSLSGMAMDEAEYAKHPYYTYGTIAAAVRGGGELQTMLASTSKGYRGMVKKWVDEVNAENPDFHLVISRSYDNPYITEAFIARLKATMSRTNYLQEVECQIVRPATLVFPEFTRKKHVVPYRYEEGTPYSIGIDPGYSHPAVTFVAHIQGNGVNDRNVIFKEFVEDDVPEEKLLNIMDQMIRETGGRPQVIASDRALPHFNQKMMRKWTDTRIKTRQSKTDQDVWSGMEVVRGLLDPTESKPLLFFSEDLLKTPGRGVIQCFEQLRRKTKDGEVQDAIYKDNINDHSVDAVSYWATAHYGRRGFTRPEKQVSSETYNRRMHTFHRR